MIDEAAIRRALVAGMEHHDAGRFAQAEAAYRGVLQAAPNRPEALVLLGELAHRAGRDDEAVDLLRKAIGIAPAVANFQYLLGIVLASRGAFDDAIAAHREALRIKEEPLFRASFAQCIVRAPRLPADAGFRELVARALSEAWMRPADLARTAIALLLSAAPTKGPIDAALRAWPERLPARELFGEGGLAALSGDRLLLSLLENAQACEWSLERFLTLARRALLEAAFEAYAPGAEPEEGTGFRCALAQQCFLNDYVFACTDDELDRAGSLREKAAAALESGAGIPESWVAAVASYFPLESMRGAAALVDRASSEALRAVVVQQVVEPRTERALREGTPKLTGVDDGVSRLVRRQYEENPYPRWVRIPAGEPHPLEAHLQRLFPHAALPP
ncbi:MAG TPA: tetratricopeptide repeat protein, partial [Usitatibacter sp.]|nr:tetratricopeptide repeat protein [Usitatibacter sp.]